MPTVTLSEIPEPGDDLEDYVAALFQPAGFFVEKNLTERDPSNCQILWITGDSRCSEPLIEGCEVLVGESLE